MARWGKCDFSQFIKMRDKFQQLQTEDLQNLAMELTNEIASRLFRRIVKRTPVGDYKKDAIVATYKRNNAKKGIKKGDTVYTKTGKVKKTNKKIVSFATSDGKNVTFKATISKVGGTLRRGWTIGAIQHIGNMYQIEIINPVEYAPYVEFGHRTRDHRGWVRGRFMMTISEKEINNQMPKIIQKRITEYLEWCMNGK